jgi:hypothetical protein
LVAIMLSDLEKASDTLVDAAEARTAFEQHRRAGGTILRVKQGEPPKRITTFDPEADKLVLIPRVTGG